MRLEVVVLSPHALIIIILPKSLHSPFFFLECLHHLPLDLVCLRDDLLHLVPLAFGFAEDREVILAVEFNQTGEVWLQVDEKPSSQVLNIIPCELQLLYQLFVGNTQQLSYLGYAIAANVDLLQLLELLNPFQRDQPAVSQR
jgi:hypothetical protein